MVYIQRRDRHSTPRLETVDEYPTRKEARTMRDEYALSDPSAEYYLSQRPCADWDAATAVRQIANVN